MIHVDRAGTSARSETDRDRGREEDKERVFREVSKGSKGVDFRSTVLAILGSMKCTRSLLSTGLALTLITLAGSASASPDFPDKIPNGNAIGCKACHTDAPPATNAFGTAYGSNDHNWNAIAGLDSDGDGKTNGEELGDPCGTGKATRTDDISNPGDSKSTTSAPKDASCEASMPPPMPSATGTSSTQQKPPPMGETTRATVPLGCASIAPISPAGGAGMLGALGLSIGALALRRRSRRQR